MHKPVVLIVLDGWGHRLDPEHNAIYAAHTPTWDHLWAHYPHALLSGSGEAVGLPSGQMGNSEVGHMTIGSGRLIRQDLSRIHHAIATQAFAENPALIRCCDDLARSNKRLHLLGLLSPGGIHSHEDHFIAAIKTAAARGVTDIAVHAFLDGRDMPPQSAKASIVKLETVCNALPGARIASLCGRFFAMDRDNRVERTQAAFDCIARASAQHHAATALEGLAAAYARAESDEFVAPTIIGEPLVMQAGDAALLMNFRADRMRQITRALLSGSELARSHTLSLTQYAEDIETTVLFPPQTHINTLGEVLAQQSLKQLRIAETEKYAHVTFFFNGGREAPFEGEVRALIPSPKVTTYDQAPAMSANALTREIVKHIQAQEVDVIIANFANPDMVGHTGNFQATVTAIETIDRCLAEIIDALTAVGGEAIISADHGNAECMFNPTASQAHTAHTSEPVPFVYVGTEAQCVRETGTLADIAPSMLTLLGIVQPAEMTGQSLLSRTAPA